MVALLKSIQPGLPALHIEHQYRVKLCCRKICQSMVCFSKIKLTVLTLDVHEIIAAVALVLC
jgi:hypothetical protein